MALEVIQPSGKPTVVFISEHAVKLTFKHLLLHTYISVTLNLGQRSFFLQRSVVRHKLITGTSAESD